MSGVSDFVVTITFFAAIRTVSGSATQCYLCNSQFCGDTYDTKLGGIASCSDVYKNAKLYSSRIVNSAMRSGALKLNNESQVDMDNLEEIEMLSTKDTNEVIRKRTHAEFFDIQRKIWDLFNKGEIDEHTQFVCVKANYNNDYGQTRTYRGCVPRYTRSISTACDFVKQKVVNSEKNMISSCYTCETDLCNSGLRLKTSAVVAIIDTIILLTILY